MKSDIGVIVLFVAILLSIVFGILAFKSCYDDHRNELGFSVMTSITTCSN